MHDLVRIDPRVAERWAEAPAWVAPALQRAPWAVVRRAVVPGAVAIGVRGGDRGQRYAASVRASDVLELRAPEALAAEIAGGGRLERAFRACSQAARECGLGIAPIGAFGFERASGFPVTRADSDLDLLVRADGLGVGLLRRFDAACRVIAGDSGVAIDVEVAFGEDGVALRELLRGGSVVAKTPRGPRIVACPR